MSQLHQDAAETGDPATDPRAFRRCLGQFSTGVTVMTTTCGESLAGVTANSFASLSMDPPLILWSIARTSRSFGAFSTCSHFAVNILGVDQVETSQRFASSGADKFEGVTWRQGHGGAPVLPGILALLECATETVHDAGDHVILIGRVTRYARFPGTALLYAQGRYAIAEDHPTLLNRSKAPAAVDASGGRELRLMALLAYVEMYASDAFDKHRQSEGVTLPQSRVLFALAQTDGLAPAEIVRHSFLTPESVDDAAASLAEMGCVALSGNRIVLTESGRQLFGKLAAQLDQFDAEQLHGLPAEDLAAARRVLEALYGRLKPLAA